MDISELEGKEVIGVNGWKIGKVKDTVVDNQTWRVTHLKVALNGNIAEELGMKQAFKTTQILIDVRRVQGVGDSVVLNTSKEDLLNKLTTVEAGADTEITAPTTVPSAPVDKP